MAEIDNSPPRSSREQRLADALRANLKRRKAQARGRAEPDTARPAANVQDALDRDGHDTADRRCDPGGD
ncbi:hypothetical protein DNX69_13255 [Rhodopseudomonas palustris]|uniref:Uncharacterized protein n=1 Tax=Rhodopseudomonas palustris TaxID=1076 RepID=A0A323UDP9_RHOPL|nr:hypothetical protein [Rhodopseudomonas palustris]PZA10343.1 hypothetical protein DNX69_13255 [Rhodopseudomonas palustris]